MFKELAKSILLYGVAASIGKFIGLFLVPIYTRIFSPYQYGTIDLINTVVALASILGMLQLESAISRYYFEVKDVSRRILFISTAFWTIVFFSTFCLITVMLFSQNISLLLFNDPRYAAVIIVASLIIPISNLFSFFSILVRFLKKPVQYILFVSIQLFFTLGISILLVVVMRIGIIGVFYGQLFGFLTASIIMLIYLRSLLHFSWSKNVLVKLFKYSLPLVPAVGGSWANSYANRFVMLGYLSIADIGIYTVALKIASIFRLLENAFRMAWGPFFWENYGCANHKEIFRKASKYVTGVICLLVSIFALFSKEIVKILATQSYIEATSLVGILAFSIGLTTISQTIGVGPAITKKTIYNTLIYFVSVIVNIGLLFLLVPSIGLIGAPISLFLGYCIMIILAWYNSERLYYIGFSKLFFAVAFIITSVIIAISLFLNISTLFKILFSFLTLLIILFFFRKQIKHLEILKKPPILRT